MTEDTEQDASRWQAIVMRDIAAVGSFVYGVKSTGIYCTPACPSRLARRENVRFFDKPDDARQGGYRACKRCCPDAQPLVSSTTRLR